MTISVNSPNANNSTNIAYDQLSFIYHNCLQTFLLEMHLGIYHPPNYYIRTLKISTSENSPLSKIVSQHYQLAQSKQSRISRVVLENTLLSP